MCCDKKNQKIKGGKIRRIITAQKPEARWQNNGLCELFVAKAIEITHAFSANYFSFFVTEIIRNRSPIDNWRLRGIGVIK